MKKNRLFLRIFLFFLAGFLFVNRGYGQWTFVSNQFGLGSFPSISVSDPNTVWLAGGLANSPIIARSTNGGLIFTNNYGNLPTNRIPNCIWAADVNNCFSGDAGTPGGSATLSRTTNGGTTWTTVIQTPDENGSITGLVFSRTQPNTGVCLSNPPGGAGTNYWLAKTVDGGNNWTTYTPHGNLQSVTSKNSLFVIDSLFFGFGTKNNNVNNVCYVVYTTNGGNHWDSLLVSVTGTAATGFAMASDKQNGIIVTDNSLPNLNRTTNGLSTITTLSGVSAMSLQGTAKWVYGTQYVYIAASDNNSGGAVEESTNGGATWSQMTTANVNTLISHIDLIYTGGTVYAYSVGVNTGTILKLSRPIGIIRIGTEVPAEYKLEQNYPNPFNPETTIKFSIPKGNFVSVKMYDMLGREVKTLVNEFKEPGNYSVTVDAAALSSGVYFYQLNAGSFTESKRLSLVK